MTKDKNEQHLVSCERSKPLQAKKLTNARFSARKVFQVVESLAQGFIGDLS